MNMITKLALVLSLCASTSVLADSVGKFDKVIGTAMVTPWTSTACTIASGASIAIGGTCNVYYTALATNVTSMTFTAPEGQQITWDVLGSGGARTLTFPAGIKWSGGTAVLALNSAQHNIYTFIKINGVLFVAAVKDMQ